MANKKIPYESLSTPEKIEVKKKKIKRLFKELPAEKMQFAEGLIYQFAVVSVTLERLADEINNGDLIEDFVQGRKSSAGSLRLSVPTTRRLNPFPLSQTNSSRCSRRKKRNRRVTSL